MTGPTEVTAPIGKNLIFKSPLWNGHLETLNLITKLGDFD